MPYVTAAQILAAVGEDDPTADQTAWATTCAADIEAAIATRLDGLTPTDDGDARLTRAAQIDGAAAYTDQAAPHGVQSIGPDGDVVRLGRVTTRALEPVLLALVGPGVA